MASLFQNSQFVYPSSVLLFPEYSFSSDVAEGSFSRTVTFDVAPATGLALTSNINNTGIPNSILKIDSEISRNNSDFSTINLSCVSKTPSGMKPLDLRSSFFKEYAKYEIALDYHNRHEYPYAQLSNLSYHHYGRPLSTGVISPRNFKLLDLGRSITSNNTRNFPTLLPTVNPPGRDAFPFVSENFSFSFKEFRPTNFSTQEHLSDTALSEVRNFSINITLFSPGDLFSETLLIGSATADFPDSYARSEYKKILNVSFTSSSRYRVFPRTFANELLQRYSPILQNGATKCFVEPIQQSYNPKTLSGSFTITWVYEV